MSLDPESCARAFVVAPTETDFETVLVARADEDCGPQVRVRLLDGHRSAVALTLNHMICDAAGFKSYIYFLCAIYTRLLADPAYRPNPVAGDRSMRRVLERFCLGVKLKSLFLQSGDNNQSGDRRFPMSEGEVDEPFILTRRLARARTAAIRDYGRTHGATLNDLALTALYRCLFRLLNLRPGAELTIPVMVDMRRYLADGDEFNALSNLSSTVVTQLRREPEEAFPRTLSRVKAEMDEKKGGDIGLNAFVKLDLLYRLCGSPRRCIIEGERRIVHIATNALSGSGRRKPPARAAGGSPRSGFSAMISLSASPGSTAVRGSRPVQ